MFNLFFFVISACSRYGTFICCVGWASAPCFCADADSRKTSRGELNGEEDLFLLRSPRITKDEYCCRIVVVVEAVILASRGRYCFGRITSSVLCCANMVLWRWGHVGEGFDTLKTYSPHVFPLDAIPILLYSCSRRRACLLSGITFFRGHAAVVPTVPAQLQLVSL